VRACDDEPVITAIQKAGQSCQRIVGLLPTPVSMADTEGSEEGLCLPGSPYLEVKLKYKYGEVQSVTAEIDPNKVLCGCKLHVEAPLIEKPYNTLSESI